MICEKISLYLSPFLFLSLPHGLYRSLLLVGTKGKGLLLRPLARIVVLDKQKELQENHRAGCSGGRNFPDVETQHPGSRTQTFVSKRTSKDNCRTTTHTTCTRGFRYIKISFNTSVTVGWETGYYEELDRMWFRLGNHFEILLMLVNCLNSYQ